MKILLFSLFCVVFTAQAQTVTLSDLTCEHLTNPIGIAEKQPRLSWKLTGEGRNIRQTAYEIRVATATDFSKKSIIWTSGKIASDESLLQPYKGVVLARERYFWQVRVWTTDGQESAWSPTAFFEMGFLSNAEWQAQWIELANDTIRYTPSVFCLHQTFHHCKYRSYELVHLDLLSNSHRI